MGLEAGPGGKIGAAVIGGELVQRVTGAAQATFAAPIASGQSLSDPVDLGDLRAVRLSMDAAWTAAVVTFQASFDGVTYRDLYDETGTEVSYTVAAGRSVRMPVADWLGVRWLKIRSGTSGSPVNQASARALTVVAQG